MEINEFIEHLIDVFDETDAELLTPTTEFKELDEWSSLTALSIIAMVDEEYDIALKGDDIRNATTIQDLFDTASTKS